MNAQNSTMGPHDVLSALGAARGMADLAAYIGACPTCLGWDDPEAGASEREAAADRDLCPTCGLASIEWDLALAIDAEIRLQQGLERLDDAVRQTDTKTFKSS